MDRYQRVEKPKTESPINDNDIRITTQGRMRNYITYATTLLQFGDYSPRFNDHRYFVTERIGYILHGGTTNFECISKLQPLMVTKSCGRHQAHINQC
ncbi:uncharacterized protein [Arachis hypogaea]|uniref:uncharacterized protein isoform X3 n=1 Tax=Arachis hypogaea TaxID=3818 RepID=UPI003B2232AC